MVAVRVHGVHADGVRLELLEVGNVTLASCCVCERVIVVGGVSSAGDGGRASEALLVGDTLDVAVDSQCWPRDA